MKIVWLSALHTVRIYPGTYFCSRLSRSRGHSAAGRVKWINHLINPIGIRTCHLPACSARPQTAPRIPLFYIYIYIYIYIYTGLFISSSGISELDCATTKIDTAERSISISRESLQVYCTRGLGVLPGSTARGSRDEKWRSQWIRKRSVFLGEAD